MPKRMKMLFNGHDRKWFNIVNKDNKEADIYILDEISYWGVTAEDFSKELNSIKTEKINLYISTPGGDVFGGYAIQNALKQHPATVTAYVQGYAASIGSAIIMAADKVVIAENGYIMIHKPWGFAAGDADDYRKQADLLDQLQGTLAGMYAKKTGLDLEDINEYINEETWFNAEKSVELGFADEISDSVSVSNKVDVSMFNKAPKIKEKPKNKNKNKNKAAKQAKTDKKAQKESEKLKKSQALANKAKREREIQLLERI